MAVTAKIGIVAHGRHRLRSTDAKALTVPRTNTHLGDRSFSVAGPKLWNSLPTTLRQPDIELEHFKRLFCLARLQRTSNFWFYSALGINVLKNSHSLTLL